MPLAIENNENNTINIGVKCLKVGKLATTINSKPKLIFANIFFINSLVFLNEINAIF